MFRSRKTLLPSFALLALLLAGCGGGSGGGGSGGGSGDSDGNSGSTITEAPYTDDEGADLSSVTLAVDEAAPMEWVEVLDLPEGFTTADGHVLYLPDEASGDPWSRDDALLMPLLIDGSDDDAIYLAAPLLELDGAGARMVVTDGLSHSAVLDLNLLPLPARRANAGDELIDAIDDMLKAGTEALGKTYPDEWEKWRDGSYNQLPPHLAPLALAWTEVMDPENPVSLVNRTYDEGERELLERVLAHRNREGRLLVETIQELAAATRDGDTLLDEASQTTPVMSSFTPPLTAGSGPIAQSIDTAPGALSAGDSGDVPTAFVDGQPFFQIHGPDALSLRLNEYVTARQLGRNIERATDIAELGGMVLTVAIPGGAGAVGSRLVGQAATRRVASFVTTSVAALGGYSAAAQWFLPCCIPDLEAELDPASGHVAFEDETPNQVKLVSVEARAESIGVNLLKEAFDRALSTLKGQLSTAGKERLSSQVKDSLDPALLKELGGDDAVIESEILVETVMGQLGVEFTGGAELVFFWEGVDLMGAEPQRWLNHEINTLGNVGTPIIEQAGTGSDRYEFKLVAPAAFERQDSLLTILTDTDELPAQIAGHTRPVSLDYIDITFNPPSLKVEEDDIVLPFTVTISNSRLFSADDPWIGIPLELEPDIGEVELVSSTNDGVFQFNYLVPDDGIPPGVIVTVSTESIIESGLRDPDNDPPPRTGSMFITADPVIVDVFPRNVCLSGGETQQYEAIHPVLGTPVDVEWSASSGSINSDGLYTAASSSGSATVTATSTEDPDVSDSVQVTLGSCICSWSAAVKGDPFASDSFFGDQGGINVSLNDARTAYESVWIFDDTTSVEVTFSESIPVGGSGPLMRSTGDPGGGLISGQGYLGVDIQTEQPLPPHEIQITEREPLSGGDGTSVALAGRVTGLVQGSKFGLPLEDQPPPADWVIEFKGTFRPEATGRLGCR